VSQPKDYDSTLARMAGNIAAGLVTRYPLESQKIETTNPETVLTVSHRAWVVDESVKLAQAIIDRCRKAKVGVDAQEKP